MIKTCLLGLGRTGSVIAEQLLNSADFELISVFAGYNSPKCDKPISNFISCKKQLLVQSMNQLEETFEQKKYDVAIDFTSADAVLNNAKKIAEKGTSLVIGTTGFNPKQVSELQHIAKFNRIGMVYAPNISLGINIMLTITKTIAKLIPHYDVNISEAHHRHKKDVPSGTALKIAREINEVNPAQQHPEIQAIRAGGIVGVHRVLFAGESDEIEITHRSYSRQVFAEGALRAARFIVTRRGFFNMEDVLHTDLTVIDDNLEEDCLG